MKKYAFGVIDPPWGYANKQENDPKRGGITYPTLRMDELYHLPIGNIFQSDATIVVWVTSPKLVDQHYEEYDPISVIRAWGFKPATIGFVWVKTYKRAVVTDDIEDISTEDFYSGLGRYTNSNIELAIIARRGKALERVNKNVKQVIIAPINGHSEKPQEQYDRYNKLWGIEDNNISAIELFARKQNPPPSHYDAVGLDWSPSIDIRDFLKEYE